MNNAAVNIFAPRHCTQHYKRGREEKETGVGVGVGLELRMSLDLGQDGNG